MVEVDHHHKRLWQNITDVTSMTITSHQSFNIKMANGQMHVSRFTVKLATKLVIVCAYITV